MTKKKIITYLTLLGVALLGLVYVMFFYDGGAGDLEVQTSSAPTAATQTPAQSASALPVTGIARSFPSPVVFPAAADLDLSVFTTAEFQKLIDYQRVTISPEEIGRENPYQ